MSTPPRRRTYTHNENDLTPQMSSKTQVLELHSKGIIQPYEGKVNVNCTNTTTFEMYKLNKLI